jgi:hypothetical protein
MRAPLGSTLRQTGVSGAPWMSSDFSGDSGSPGFLGGKARRLGLVRAVGLRPVPFALLLFAGIIGHECSLLNG